MAARAPRPAPGEVFACASPAVGQRVAINGRGNHESVAGTVIGCRQREGGRRGSDYVVGLSVSRARVHGAIAHQRGKLRARLGAGTSDAPRPRSAAPPVWPPERPRLALPAPRPDHGDMPWQRPALPHFATEPAVRAPAPPRPQLPELTPFQHETVSKEVGYFFDAWGIRRAGFLPVRLDEHPDGRVRIVAVMTRTPAGFDGPKDRPIPPGTEFEIVIHRVADKDRYDAARGVYIVDTGSTGLRKLEPNPAWVPVTDLHVTPPTTPRRGGTFTETLEEAIDRSGYKLPAKIREASAQHWVRVASALHHRQAVAPEVLADYPGLAEFFAASLTAGPSRATFAANRAKLDATEDPDITVEWSAESGLLLYTRGKVQKIIDAIKGLRHQRIATFKWSGHMGAWFRPQSVGVSVSTVDIDLVADALRAAGMRVAVDRGEVGTLGAANERRSDHKEWRAERYAERAGDALAEGERLAGEASRIRGEVPVGAPTRRAERMEARADRRDAGAVEEAEYVEHAAQRAENLARTAAGYDVTATITRKQAERRADEFARLFVAKVKGRTGAVRLDSRKTDNLSEYKLVWAVFYPPSADSAASVSFDGRTALVQVYAGVGRMEWDDRFSLRRGYSAKGTTQITLQEDATALSPAEVFEHVVAALPQVKIDAGALAPTDPKQFVTELSAYGKRRVAPLTAVVDMEKHLSLGVRYGRVMYDRWTNLEIVQSGPNTAGFAQGEGYQLAMPEGQGLRMRLVRSRYSGMNKAEALGAMDVDFTGLSIAEGWELIVASVKALHYGKSVAEFLPKKKKPAKPAQAAGLVVERGASPGVGRVEPLARDLPDAERRARVEEIREGLAPTVDRARALRQSVAARQDGELKTLVAAAREHGHDGAFYPTAPALARYVVGLAGVSPGDRVLEPSAGMGAIVEALLEAEADVTAVEVDPARAAVLRHRFQPRAGVIEGDFLYLSPEEHDAVVMNPPFSIGGRHYTDAEHVLHALQFVRPGGRLVAIMSASSQLTNHHRRAELHAELSGWTTSWEAVEPGRFAVSGTDVPVVILTADRPRANPSHHHPATRHTTPRPTRATRRSYR